MQAKEINWFKKQLRERPVPVWMIEFRTESLSVSEGQEETKFWSNPDTRASGKQGHASHTVVLTTKRQKTTVPGPFFPPGYLDQTTQLFSECQKQRWKECFQKLTPSQNSETGISIKASYIGRPAEILPSPITQWMQVLKPTGHINSRDICKHNLRLHQEFRAPFPLRKLEKQTI